MRSCPSADGWIARARPALGTIVEIALPRSQATAARFDAAFACVDTVQATMSAHDPASDLALISREAHRHAVTVHHHTWRVLHQSLELADATGGRFDVTVAPLLARAGRLPAAAAGFAQRCGHMDALVLEHGDRVRTTRPVGLDLGGIAKGYAVDCAVDALRAAGATCGRVNAGGDLRVFGAGNWQTIRVRDPACPTQAIALFDLSEHAAATSADYHRDAAELVDPRCAELRRFGASITVVAPTCMLADALTKIVALDPQGALALLRRYTAHAFRLESHPTGLQASTTCSASTPVLRLPLVAAA